MEKIKTKYKHYFSKKEFIISFISSIIFLFVAVLINFYAGTYAAKSASLPVTDIILSNIRPFDVDGFFVYAPIFLFIFMLMLCLSNPRKIPFVTNSLSLFIIIRSVFISLTHIGPFPTQAMMNNSNIFVNKFTFGGDLFFSGHTGIPFLLALIFWQNRTLRYFLLAYSIFMGIIVLLGHYHYSIDVLSAFFITYTIFHMALYLFKKDREMFGE
ncbi:MAG: phosphatase PAP2-related protein [Candidatus Paceibacterota bacterium]